MKAGKYILKMNFFLRISLISLIMSGCGSQYANNRRYHVSHYVSLGQYKQIKVFKVTDMDQQEAEEQLANDLWAIIYDNARVNNYPRELYEEMYVYLDLETQELASHWNISREEYLDLFVGMDLAAYAEDLTRAQLVFKAIMEQEKIGLTPEEYDRMLPLYAKECGFYSREEMEQEYERDEIVNFLIAQKTCLLLKEQAVITEVTQDVYQEKYNIEQ